MKLNAPTRSIMGAAIKVHQTLGPGLLSSSILSGRFDIPPTGGQA